MSNLVRASAPISCPAAALAVVLAASVPCKAVYGQEIRASAAFAVARDPGGQKAATMVDALLKQRLQKEPSMRNIEPSRVFSGDPRTREEETLERARAAFTDGRRAYDALALDDAIARLGQAVGLYQETGALLGDLLELQGAMAYLASALVLRGSADEGESTFVELLTINPGYNLDGFPPTVERVFDRAAQRVESNPTGSVEIYSTPPYAAVYIDGRFEGVTPLTVTDLIVGTHYVRLEKTGYVIHGAPVAVSPRQRITSQTRLRGIRRGAELRDLTGRCVAEVLADGMGGALRSVARELVADTLIFVAVTQSGSDVTLTGAVFDGAAGTRVTTERAVLTLQGNRGSRQLKAYVDRLIQAAKTGQGNTTTARTDDGSRQTGSAFGLSDGSNDDTGPIPRTTVSRKRDSTTLEYLGWTLTGVGAASMAVGIGFGVAALVSHGDFRDTPQASPDLSSIRDTGKRNALIADVTLITGGVIAAGGLALLLTNALQTPSASDLLDGTSAAVTPHRDGAVVSVGGRF